MVSAFETSRVAFIGGTKTVEGRKEGMAGLGALAEKKREKNSRCVVVLWSLSY